MRAVVRAIFLFALFFAQAGRAGIRVLCDYPATPLSRYTVNLVQNKLVRLAWLDYSGSLLVRLQIDEALSERLGEEGIKLTSALTAPLLSPPRSQERYMERRLL